MRQPKHILYITQYFHTPAEGGLLRTWAIAKHLSSRGYKVTVIAASPHHMSGEIPEGYKGRLFNRFSTDGIDVVKVYSLDKYRNTPLRRVLYYLMYPFLAFLPALRTKRPDVVIASSPPLSILPVGYLVSIIKDVPYCVEIRDAWLEFATARGLVPQILSKSLFRLRRFFLRRAKRVIAVTPGIQRILGDCVANKSAVALVMNGFEDELHTQVHFSEEDVVDFRKAHGLDGKFVVTYTGTLGMARDLLVFGQAARHLREYRDITFLFVGDGEKKKELMDFCKDLDNCIFLPLQPRTRIPLILRASEVAINSIRKNDALESSLSNKIFDYLGSAVPVVFAGEGDTAEFLEQSGGGIVVEPENAEEMAAAILKLYKDPELRVELGKAGQEYVFAGYTRRKMLDRLEGTIADLTA